jgi:8-oxo-dGTP diphosphatase
LHQHIRVTADAVVIRFAPNEGLQVLLSKRSIPPHIFKWGLPGGFVQNDEPIEKTVHRELKAETGLTTHYLEQFKTFANPERDPRGRVIGIIHLSFIRFSKSKLLPGAGNKEAQWFSLWQLPTMAFDHQSVIEEAIVFLRRQFYCSRYAYELVEVPFPISELERLYENLFQKKVDRRNFQKKVHHLGLLEAESEKRKHPVQGRPAQLYRFNFEKFEGLLKENQKLELFPS